MKTVVQIGTRSKGGRKGPVAECTGDRPEIDARAELIQALIPPVRGCLLVSRWLPSCMTTCSTSSVIVSARGAPLGGPTLSTPASSGRR